jgi:hypothetical protein
MPKKQEEVEVNIPMELLFKIKLQINISFLIPFTFVVSPTVYASLFFAMMKLKSAKGKNSIYTYYI